MGLVYNFDTDRLDYVANVEDGTAAGQLAFWDSSNWVPAETSELVWDDTNKRLGVGVASPDDTFHVHGTAGGLRLGRVGADGVLRCYVSSDDIVFQSNHADGDLIFKTQETAIRLVVSSGGNFGLGTGTFGTSAAGTIAFVNGTAPTGNVTNQHAYYGADFAAGNACPYFRTENGTVIGLNQSLLTTDSLVFAALDVTGNITVGGTVDGIDVAGRDHNSVTLNASATTGGLSLSTQEISHRAATNAQTGYATAAHITAIEANTAHAGDNSQAHTDYLLNSGADAVGGDLNFGGLYQTIGLQAPAAAGESIRQTTNVTETNLETLVGTGDADALHTHNAKANLAGPTFSGTVTVPSTNFTIGSTTFSETQLGDLTDGGDTTAHDHDGIAENTAARHSNAGDHTQGTDTTLGTMTADIDMNNSYQVVNLQAPAASGEAIRATAKITEAKMEAADDHVAATGNQHGHDTHDHSTALGTGIASDLSDITSAGADIEDAVTKKHVAVTLNASATTGGMSLSTQEISNRAASNAQTGYATAAHITSVEANASHVAGDGSDHADVATNTTHSGGDGSDHADVATNTAASHAEAHTVASHSDTTGTGAELNTLTDNSMADTLHRHSELSASDGTPDQAVVVDASGNVGIGTSPDCKLEVKAASSGSLDVINVEESNGNDIFNVRQTGSNHGEVVVKTAAAAEKIRLSGDGNSFLNGGNVGIGDSTPSTILDVVAGSDTDPVADSWDTHCGRHNQVDLGEAVGSRLGNFREIKLYHYHRKAVVGDEEVTDELIKDLENGPLLGFEDKRAQLEAVKVQLPKFATMRVGIMMDDSSVPSEILTFDDVGNKTGISGNGYIGYLHKVVRDQQVVMEGFEERIVALEQEQG